MKTVSYTDTLERHGYAIIERVLEQAHRQVIHLEFAATPLPGDLQWHRA
jgi:hypothetical protein